MAINCLNSNLHPHHPHHSLLGSSTSSATIRVRFHHVHFNRFNCLSLNLLFLQTVMVAHIRLSIHSRSCYLSYTHLLFFRFFKALIIFTIFGTIFIIFLEACSKTMVFLSLALMVWVIILPNFLALRSKYMFDYINLESLFLLLCFNQFILNDNFVFCLLIDDFFLH